MSAAALGVNPSPDASDEKGPDIISTKSEVIGYLSEYWKNGKQVILEEGSTQKLVR